MTKNLATLLWIVGFVLSTAALADFTEGPKKYRVWVDGIYDLAHYGHQKSFEKARALTAQHFHVDPGQVEVIVGVCGGDIKAYKREPVFSLEQRVSQIQSFKGVDKVVADAPLLFNESYIEKYQIDLVMHGDDYTEEKIHHYYPGLLEKGIFKIYPYEPGISSSYITRRAAQIALETLLQKQDLGCGDKEAVEHVLSLMNPVS